MNELALIICSKKPIRTLEEYALTLTGIPPLPRSSQKALEDEESQRLYIYNLTTLQRAVSTGAIQAFPDKFSDNPKEYVCSFKDFLAWVKANELDDYREQVTPHLNRNSTNDFSKKITDVYNWQVKAREIGEIIYKAKPTLSIEQIAIQIQKEMVLRKANGEDGISGRGGKVPSADTIKRHALIGIKS